MTLLRSPSLAFALAALLAGPPAFQAAAQTAVEPPPVPTLIEPAPTGQPEAPDPAAQGAPAAQAAPVDPEAPAVETGQTEESGLTSEEVRENQPAPPTDQGTLQPEVVEGDEQAPDLYALLSRVRAAPAGLDGQPIPRPNPLGSEPTPEMTPAQPEDPSLFPEGYVE